MALSHRLAGFAWLSPSPNLAQGLGNNLKSKCLSLLFPTGSTVVCDYVLDTRQYVTSAPCALLPRQAATRVCVCVCVCVCVLHNPPLLLAQGCSGCLQVVWPQPKCAYVCGCLCACECCEQCPASSCIASGTTQGHLNHREFPHYPRRTRAVVGERRGGRTVHMIHIYSTECVCVVCVPLCWVLLCHSDPCQGLKPSPRQVQQQNS